MKTLLISAAIAASTLFGASTASATQAWVEHGISLNARSGPGTGYHVLGTFSPCTKVHVVGHKHGWAKVSFNHHHYWVSAKYLSNHACRYAKPKHKSYGY
ncbi:SH3 domain-containing protein [Cognatishimia sp. F0-27]|uniref:SH3 domain-containing protein n=1 Tax=Cognatishimia sp. F0-27 TaxID=2816855 RepID=UPI001D0C742B|nr:SH3 domain-containing protein [Cognatishimia sp. F0-27]MCC1491880.1 SH3 domain-containing protein [Cognatishimia sp. F0-27]